jgi:hypothetical protein
LRREERRRALQKGRSDLYNRLLSSKVKAILQMRCEDGNQRSLLSQKVLFVDSVGQHSLASRQVKHCASCNKAIRFHTMFTSQYRTLLQAQSHSTTGGESNVEQQRSIICSLYIQKIRHHSQFQSLPENVIAVLFWPAAFLSSATFVASFVCCVVNSLALAVLPCATSIWILRTSVCSFNTLFLIFPFWSAVPAVVPVPPAAAIASLNPPAPVSASSLTWAALEMMARSDAATAARLFWSTCVVLTGRIDERGGEKGYLREMRRSLLQARYRLLRQRH